MFPQIRQGAGAERADAEKGTGAFNGGKQGKNAKAATGQGSRLELSRTCGNGANATTGSRAKPEE